MTIRGEECVIACFRSLTLSTISYRYCNHNYKLYLWTKFPLFMPDVYSVLLHLELHFPVWRCNKVYLPGYCFLYRPLPATNDCFHYQGIWQLLFYLFWMKILSLVSCKMKPSSKFAEYIISMTRYGSHKCIIPTSNKHDSHIINSGGYSTFYDILMFLKSSKFPSRSKFDTHN